MSNALADAPCRTMKRWLGLSVLVVLTVATLTPLAYATPPDQTWIAGLYDNADYDDVVALVTSTASVENTPPQHGFELLHVFVAALSAHGTAGAASPSLAFFGPRAPPTA